MSTLGTIFDQGMAGLTVYSPDCTHSQLWGNLDQFIAREANAQIIYRQWIYHDYNSIMRFYKEGDTEVPYRDPAEARLSYTNIPPEKLQYGHLMVRLFISGVSLLTLWQGEDIIPKLLTVKGATQPAKAVPNSVRGGFWCDNGVCNLMHTSDNTDEALRELSALNLSQLLNRNLPPLSEYPMQSVPPMSTSHSGIATVCGLVNRILLTTGDHHTMPIIPASGESKLVQQVLSDHLHEVIAQNKNRLLTDFVQAFLGGDTPKVSQMMTTLPLTDWEKFVIQCGVINRYEWKSSVQN